MQVKRQTPRRLGAVTIEMAIVLPVLLVLLLGILVGGMGVFRYQLVACQAREAARYASVRGADWQLDAGVSPLLQDDVVKNVVHPLATTMDLTQLTVKMEWVDQGAGTVKYWDSSPKYVKTLTPDGEYVTAAVRVTVSYTWYPEYFLGPCTLTSVCEIPMCN